MNLVATAIALARGAIWLPFCGIVVFVGSRRGTVRRWVCMTPDGCPADWRGVRPDGQPLSEEGHSTMTTTTANIPTPAEVYMSQRERARDRNCHTSRNRFGVYLMRDWDGIDRLPLPSADDLLHLLAESLGYTLTRAAQW
ncbi:hypothetical protein [Rhodococcus sp. IEGM 1307]|uniref:hypothetical protein n=1 Tax=Rhodococcus sp. IEGM 1307 TaxID=3047091 RepID=UPI0024B72478|nr:hypothetical protein [Rhodococcus sp. IEGM 1307]MDI9979826.1 hypothetical protein [Rhodococcus sp. IEGM 1307]